MQKQEHKTWSETAIEEIKRVGLLDKDSDYAGILGNALIELVEVFAKQGHSGASAYRTAELFHRLVEHGGKFNKPKTKKD